MAETNARELYLRPITPQQLLARLPEHELAVKVSREDLEVRGDNIFGSMTRPGSFAMVRTTRLALPLPFFWVVGP